MVHFGQHMTRFSLLCRRKRICGTVCQCLASKTGCGESVLKSQPAEVIIESSVLNPVKALKTRAAVANEP